MRGALGLKIGAGLNEKRIAGIPPIISDGNTVAWYDYLENITKDGADLVSVWGDKSGNSNDLLQATGTNQPLWTGNGVLFDGIDNFMKTAPFTLNQPECLYIVLKQVTWTLNDWLFDGNTGQTGAVYQNGSSPRLRAHAGIAGNENANLAVNTYGIIKLLFNGASSKFQINETTAITGDFGAANMGGFTLGAKGNNLSFANIETPEIIIRKVADTTENKAIIYNYLANKYGI